MDYFEVRDCGNATKFLMNMYRNMDNFDKNDNDKLIGMMTITLQDNNLENLLQKL